MEIAVAGSSGLAGVLGVPAGPAALLALLQQGSSDHILFLTPRHLERRAREQAHVVVAARRGARVGVVAFDHHALTLTLVAASVLDVRDQPAGWSEAGDAIQLVEQIAARSRSVVWHPRVLGLRQPVPSVAQSAASLVRASGYFAELGASGGLVRGVRGFAPDGNEALYVAGEPTPLLLRQLGESEARTVTITPEGGAPYQTRRSIELCGLVAPVWAPLAQDVCPICATSRAPSGCHFCGTGADPRTEPAVATHN